MKEIRGNLFDPSTYRIQPPLCRGWVPAKIIPDAICITTNGFTKKNGEAVMGRGCALEASRRWPDIKRILGNFNKTEPLRPYILLENVPYTVVSFPVKNSSFPCASDKSNVVSHMKGRFEPGDIVPGWACKARIGIIEYSAINLMEMAEEFGWEKIILPRPGSGAGELIWKDVKVVLDGVLDDRFYCITWW